MANTFSSVSALIELLVGSDAAERVVVFRQLLKFATLLDTQPHRFADQFVGAAKRNSLAHQISCCGLRIHESAAGRLLHAGVVEIAPLP